MDDILSAPFVSHVTAAPDGSFVVWEVHERGQRNLYANNGGTPHAITTFDADDGQDFDNVAVLRDGQGVVYLRGGTQDNAGDANINPLSLVPPPVRGIYVQSIHGGTPLLVGEGYSPVASPKGDTIAFVSGSQLMFAAVQHSGDTYTAAKPVALQIRGNAANPVWSPDGARIAFTNGRDNHQFIVIYSVATHSYVYATPDFANDDYAAWSPDGTQVAFARTPGSREDENAYSLPSREPWSIWVADANSGNAHRVWSANRGMGAQMYPSENSAQQVWWLRDGRLAFLWEGTGWQNLYTVAQRGGTATAVANGHFEVETVSQSLDGKTLYLASNQGDIDRRHLWSYDANGLHQLTRGTQNQWGAVGLRDGDYLYINSDYATPTTLTRRDGSSIVAVATPANFPARDVVEPKLITFRAPDGLIVHAQLFVPRTPGKHAAMIFDHGGPVRQMLAGFHYMEAYTNLYESNQFLANHGFVVLSINYRSGIMYGHDFREAKDRGPFGASEYQDVLAGAKYLQSQRFVDANRLGIYGLSYGGYLAALGLARNSDIFKAGVDYAGVHNWATIFDDESNGKIIGTRSQRRIARDASPIAAIDRWRSPVFLSQGDDDRNVPFAQGVDLATRLRDRGVHVETMVFPNETHENQVYAHEVALYEAAAAFLSRQLHP